MEDSIERYCKSREAEDPNFSRLSFFREFYGNDTDGDHWFRLWVHGKVCPISLQNWCEAKLNDETLARLADRQLEMDF